MKFMIPLGFIAILSVAILVVIYLIKPSYKSKTLPSTYIWKESLKYRKKDKKDSLFRNILSFLCQATALVALTAIITYPVITISADDKTDLTVVIIDASADMRASNGAETRFQRAKNGAAETIKKSTDKKIPVTIILADTDSKYLAENELNYDKLISDLTAAECGFGSGDISGAAELATKAAGNDKYIKAYCYTATKYDLANGVEVIDISDPADRNISVTDLKSENNENFYDFTAKVTSVGREEYMSVVLTVNGVNDDKSVRRLEKKVNCVDGKTVTVKFDDTGVYAYKNASVAVFAADGSTDGIPEDDVYYLYDGEKESLKIQYSSTAHNNFVSGQLLVLKDSYSSRYEVEISEPTRSSQIKTSGFDLYIFEHSYPQTMPKDGVVLLIDAPAMPAETGVTVGYKKNGDFKLTAGAVSSLTKFVDIDKITATTYYPLTADEGKGYDTLAYCNGDPVLVAKNAADEKVAVLGINFNASNFPMLFGFPVFFNNIFEYYFPVTTDKLVYDAGEVVSVTARGNKVVYRNGITATEQNSPTFNAKTYRTGNYSVTQTLISGKDSVTDIFVKIPEKESLLIKNEKEIFGADNLRSAKEERKDLYLYLAIAVCAFVFAERLLYSLKAV